MTELANPYAAPGAAVTDVGPENEVAQSVRVFAFSGRIGRLRYMAYLMGSYLAMMALMIPAAAVMPKLIGRPGENVSAAAIGMLGVIGIVAFLANLLFYIVWTVRRGHDMGASGWTAILSFIPLAALVWALVPGAEVRNRFGAPPPPNTLGVKILGMILPAIFIIGILAAVAIPAYQQYTERYRAAQVDKP